MTTDRRKAILFLILTLIIGIVIGSLIPAFFGRFHGRHGREAMGGKEWNDNRDSRGRKPMGDRKQWLTHTVIRVVQPDSDQVKAIRPLTQKATAQIGELEKNSNERMVSIFDSLNIKLKPILSEEQNKKLEEFSTKARERWKGRH
jgi:hypothetical protein